MAPLTPRPSLAPNRSASPTCESTPKACPGFHSFINSLRAWASFLPHSSLSLSLSLSLSTCESPVEASFFMCIRVTGSLLVQFIDLGQFITEPQKITTLTTAQETIRIIHHCHAEGLVKTLIWRSKAFELHPPRGVPM